MRRHCQCQTNFQKRDREGKNRKEIGKWKLELLSKALRSACQLMTVRAERFSDVFILH